MAKLRTDHGFLRHVWMAALLAVVIYGGSMLFGQAAAPAPQPEDVVAVRIEGNQTVPEAKVRRHIHTRAGRPFEMEKIEDDVRQLYATRLFVGVKTYSEQVPGGRVVVFRVTERPTVNDVLFVGNRKVKDKVLQKEITLKAGDASDPFAVEEDRRKIEEFYHGRGFSKARVSVFEGDKPTDRRVVFLINEGRKQRFRWTKFVGNTIASDARLRTQIESKPGIFWIFKGEVDSQKIEEDLNRLTAYYRGLGFFRAKVERELEFNDDQDWLTLTFVINEGPRYRVRNVSFIGNKRFGADELDEDVKLKDGQYFNQDQMTHDVSTIQDKYGGIGYVFADVNADTRFLEEPGTVDLVYEVTEGDRYRVGKINVRIKGEYPHTKYTTVLNRLSFKPGDIVDTREIRASERRLRASGLFSVNPMQGAPPKVVFSPPELDDAETQVASPPKRRPKVRGQSPDLVPCGDFQWSRSPDSTPGDPRVDLTLPCEWVQPAARPEDQRKYQQPVPRPQSPVGFQSPVEPPRMVVRGQAPGGGRMVPELPSRQLAPQPTPSPTYLTPPPTAYTQQPSGMPAGMPAATPYPAPAPNPPYTTQPVVPAPAPGHHYVPRGGAPLGGRLLGPPSGRVNEPIFDPDSPFLGGQPDEDFLRPLDIQVLSSETQTGRLMFGVGINSDAGLVGSIVLDEQNFDWRRCPRSWADVNPTMFRGGGQRFRVELIPGTQVQRYMVNFSEPYLFDSAIALGLSGYLYDRRYVEWDEQRLGGRMSFGYQFTHDLSGTFAYRGAKININDPIVPSLPELAEVVGDNALHGFQFQLTHDTRDNRFLATEGHLIEMAFEQVIGSFEYPRAKIDMRRYFLMHERPDGSGRHVLSLSGRAEFTGDDTPIYDHYYAGGFSTIRGFDFRGASPRDPGTGVLVGGHFLMLAKIQYMFPITADDMLRAVVFCDSGTVEPTVDNWSDTYRVAPGFGLRITVPAMGPAPIALDFAFPIRSANGDREEVFSFFVGFNH